jgi:hypothetical protein
MNNLRPSQIIIMASGVVMFLFSFFAWYKSSLGGGSTSAWGSGLFPLAWFVPIFGIISAAVMAAVVFGGVRLPEPILSFSWRQIHFVLAFTALVIAVGFLLVDAPGIDRGVGFWFNLLGAIGLTVGSVMELLSPGQSRSPRSGPATPF